jgi:hypothetical protein
MGADKLPSFLRVAVGETREEALELVKIESSIHTS